MATGSSDIPPRAGRREWIGLAVLALAVLVYVMDLTVLYLAVPRLSADLEPTSAELLWIIDVYGFVVAGSLIMMGTVGDRIGRRRLFLIGVGGFAAVSVLAAFSVNTGMLIATRALMGLVGATLAPSTLSLIFVMFKDSKQRSLAIGVWLAAFSAGSAVGPVLGGITIEHFWWGSVFLLAVPIMALLLVIGPLVLPEYRDLKGGRPDLPSAVLSLAAVLAGIFALKEAAQDGFGLLAGTSLAVGALLGVVFVRRQRSLENPLVDLKLFSVPGFGVALATNATSIFVSVGYFVFVAQYLQLVIGLSPSQAGLWSVPSAAGFIAGSILSPRFVHRIRPGLLIPMCMGLAAVGMGLLMRVGIWGDLPVAVTASVLVSLAIAPVFNLTTQMIVGDAPPEKAGTAAGIAETATELGGSLGLAILGSIGTAVYRSRITTDVPADTPTDVVDSLLDTLGGAVGVLDRLPSDVGAVLLDVARDAFVQGLRLAALVAGVIAIAVGLWAGFLLRGMPPVRQTGGLVAEGAADGSDDV